MECLLPLEPRSSLIISGPSSSGKSLFTKRLIEQLDKMYKSDPPVKVLYCYGVHQHLYDEMEKSISSIQFHDGLPTEEFIYQFADGKHTLIVFDDLMNSCLNSDMVERLFVQPGYRARTINLNASYLCLFHNIRDKLQVNCLAKQMYPCQTKVFMEAYQDSTKERYGYLFVDMSPHSDNEYRLRTNIFPGETTYIYTAKQ